MTVQAFYAERAIEGRAPLKRDRVDYEPTAWISRASRRGAVSYWLCRRDDFEIEEVEPGEDVSRLRVQPYRQRTVMPSPREAADRLWSLLTP